MSRKLFSRDFKLSAVKLIIEEQLGIKQVASDLSLHVNTLYRWVTEFETHGDQAFPGNGRSIQNKDFELKKLKLENNLLKRELEILKKYQAFLNKKRT